MLNESELKGIEERAKKAHKSYIHAIASAAEIPALLQALGEARAALETSNNDCLSYKEAYENHLGHVASMDRDMRAAEERAEAAAAALRDERKRADPSHAELSHVANDYEYATNTYWCRACTGEWKPGTPPVHDADCWVGKMLAALAAKEKA